MPPGTKIQTFIDALRSRETHFTQVADNLFQNPGNLRSSEAQAWAEFQQPNALDTPLTKPSSGAIRACLLKPNRMTQAEVDHIDRWDNREKEKVRDRLATEINKAQPAPMKFHWELYGGANELAHVADNTIIFRSPQKGVKITSPPSLTQGEVEIDK